MRRLLPLSMMLLFSTTACSGVHTVKTQGVLTIPLTAYEEDPGKYGAPMAEGGEPVIIKVAEGEKVPLQIDVAVPFAAVEAGESYVRFDKEVFIYLAPGKFKVSPDSQRWADISNWKAMKKLFGFKKGLFSVGLGISQKDGAFMTLAVRTVDE